MAYRHTIGKKTYGFDTLKTLMAKASPFRSGDALAGLTASSYEERVAAQITLADVPLKTFLQELLIPYENDEVTRLIVDSHEEIAFQTISHLTVGEFRDWLLSETTDGLILQKTASGITPEMAAAVCKVMRNQDLIAVAAKIEVIIPFSQYHWFKRSIFHPSATQSSYG